MRLLSSDGRGFLVVRCIFALPYMGKGRQVLAIPLSQFNLSSSRTNSNARRRPPALLLCGLAQARLPVVQWHNKATHEQCNQNSTRPKSAHFFIVLRKMGNILVNGTQNELVVATDCRGTQILIGDTTFILPGFTELQVWDLNIFTVKTESIDVISKLGIKVCMSSVAQISIQAFTDQARTSVDEDAILRAHVFMYGKHTDAEIRAGKGHDMPELAREEIATIMEGHQRSIIGSLTVEELRSDPKKVQELVRKIVTPDLVSLVCRFALLSPPPPPRSLACPTLAL